MIYNTPYTPYYQLYPMQTPQAPQTPQAIQNGGFISVRNEEEARAYPVAPGNSVTFKNENAPYCYTKTMGFSQLDPPVFERYRLVKEEGEEAVIEPQAPPIDYLPTETFNTFTGDFDALKKRVAKLERKFKAVEAEDMEE